jgi:hypothetical protein
VFGPGCNLATKDSERHIIETFTLSGCGWEYARVFTIFGAERFPELRERGGKRPKHGNFETQLGNLNASAVATNGTRTKINAPPLSVQD